MPSTTFTDRLMALEHATRSLAEFEFDTDLLAAPDFYDVVDSLNGIPTGSSQALVEFLDAARPNLVLELLERSRSAGRVRVETGDRAIEVPVASTAGQSILAEFLAAVRDPLRRAEVDHQVAAADEVTTTNAPVEVASVIAHAGRSLLASVGLDHLAMVTDVLGELCDDAESGDQVRRGLVALDAVLAPLIPLFARLREYTEALLSDRRGGDQ